MNRTFSLLEARAVLVVTMFAIRIKFKNLIRINLILVTSEPSEM